MCIWDDHFFTRSYPIKSRYYLTVCGTWKGITGQMIIVNVYAPQAATKKKKILWAELLELKRSIQGIWIFLETSTLWHGLLKDWTLNSVDSVPIVLIILFMKRECDNMAWEVCDSLTWRIWYWNWVSKTSFFNMLQ